MNGTLIVTAFFIVLIALLEAFHYRERQIMLDRLMAKNLPEYKQQTENAGLPKPRNHIRNSIEQSRKRQQRDDEE